MRHRTWVVPAGVAILALATLPGIGADTPAVRPPSPTPLAAPATAPTSQPSTQPAFDLDRYAGKPFGDAPAAVPGSLTCAYFDRGGEGVAYHDLDAINHGSGQLNKGPADRDHFREKEAVDVSYTKAAFDKFADGKLLPVDEYYVGWTNAGEWLNYTVDVTEAGTYTVKALLSSNNRDAAVSLSVDGVDKTGPLAVRSTGHWHTWQTLDHLADVPLDKGRHVITLVIVREGNMNLGTLEFAAKPARPRP